MRTKPKRPRPSTRERILEASRHLFNRKGYADTTIVDIASEVGIAEGNLWYHFRTKRHLVAALEEQVRGAARAAREALSVGRPVAEDYVRAVVLGMSQKWAYRFLFRDYRQFGDGGTPLRLDPDMTADLDMLRDALDRMQEEGFFRRDLSVDLDVLARSLWIVGRYWTDYLQEQEGLENIEWSDQLRGFEHYFAVLFPHLTAAARRSLETALERVSTELTAPIGELGSTEMQTGDAQYEG